MHHGDEERLDKKPDNIPPASFVDLPEGDNNYNNDVASLSSQIQNGNVMRDATALQMAQNGWTSDAWNRMVRKFLKRFPYVAFSKDQIQDKEKELKRDFRVLKEARKQSGVHWDEKLCMIMVEPAIWDNIIVSHPKASKFQRQGFPLYDDLERLYDGKTAEGNLAFISIESKDDDVRVVQALKEQVTHDGAMGSLASLSGYSDDEDDGDNDEDVQIVHPPKQISTTTSSRRNAFTSSRDKRAAAEKDVEPTASGAIGAKVGQKRKKNGDVADMMGRYLELKTKQTEEELAEQERAKSQAEEADELKFVAGA
ncbi:hypothetical protein QOZ80_3BG0271390 [Eleusine coracana subsp. coracana]|nr:hypothetical protein QOZ80_3BG0271390 [Eleusine coracana subsp. coracana]